MVLRMRIRISSLCVRSVACTRVLAQVRKSKPKSQPIVGPGPLRLLYEHYQPRQRSPHCAALPPGFSSIAAEALPKLVDDRH